MRFAKASVLLPVLALMINSCGLLGPDEPIGTKILRPWSIEVPAAIFLGDTITVAIDVYLHSVDCIKDLLPVINETEEGFGLKIEVMDSDHRNCELVEGFVTIKHDIPPPYPEGNIVVFSEEGTVVSPSRQTVRQVHYNPSVQKMFFSTDEYYTGIIASDIDGNNRAIMTRFKERFRPLAISPDGQKLYASHTSESLEPSGLYVMDVEERQPRLFTSKSQLGDLARSVFFGMAEILTGGNKVVIDNQDGFISIFDDDGQNHIKVDIPHDETHNYGIHMDRGANKIVTIIEMDSIWTLYEIDPATGAFQDRYATSKWTSSPIVLPDGETIAFVSGDWFEYRPIHLLAAGATKPIILLPDSSFSTHELFPLPGHDAILAVVYTDIGNSNGEQLIRIETDGSGYTILSEAYTFILSVAAALDGSSILVRGQNGDTAVISVVQSDGSGLSELTRIDDMRGVFNIIEPLIFQPSPSD